MRLKMTETALDWGFKNKFSVCEVGSVTVPLLL